MNNNDDSVMWERLMASREPRVEANTTESEPAAEPVAAPVTDLIHEKKLADKDYNENGKLEDPETEYKGAVDNAIQRSKRVASETDKDDDDLDQSEEEPANEQVTHDVDTYIRNTVQDFQQMGRERWFRNCWRRDRAILEACATGTNQQPAPFNSWSGDDYWRALVGVEREFYGLSD